MMIPPNTRTPLSAEEFRRQVGELVSQCLGSPVTAEAILADLIRLLQESEPAPTTDPGST